MVTMVPRPFLLFRTQEINHDVWKQTPAALQHGLDGGVSHRGAP